MTRIRASLTYANVIATVALFLALGGGAYAALKLPKNSVGSKQIKKGAVTSAKVKNGSLAAGDFKAGTLPRGPQGQQGEQGQQGLQGLQGGQGAPGRDGAAVVARVRSTGSVETPADGSSVSLPLTSATWTQAANEVDLLPYGDVKITLPDSNHCSTAGSPPNVTGGFVDVFISVYVDGSLVSSTTIPGPADGGTKHPRLPAPTYLYEPGSAAAHTVTAKFSSQCDATAEHASVTVSDLTLDVIRAF
jgi:hypothetical protein